ncbi:NmrA family NAD(P)-binding protein [Mucilaginibacter sp. cycad4]|uniref:NmrA family NAD(P)-binding protein n=1 Tax=Mucilaginibacter sp. cycad4 TaxID=3342096 RepID=UPI002AAB631D|nr:NmrA family NAD(P)-binding protein [Mucilaginibacter gossypii]WPU99133.1 NmrA family NAD(P)-binding protein [Mucilaginibacter gossypii]
MSKKLKVLITGATGKSGSAAIDELLEMGNPVRAFVHSLDERSEKLAAKGVEVFAGDLHNFDEISVAMKGIDTAYFCFPVLVPGVLEATSYFAVAGKEAGLKGIVNMSQISARRDAKSHAAQDHWIGEQILNMTGIPITHLRPTFFDDWFLYIREGIKKDNKIVLPFGDGRWAPVDSGDLGRAVARIAAEPMTYAGEILKLYGPEEYNVYEMSEVLSSVLGRKIKYEPVNIERWAELDAERGADDHFLQHVTNVALDCMDGIFAGTNDTLGTIIGDKPTTLSEFFTTWKAAF